MRKKIILFLTAISFSCSSGGDDPTPIPIDEPQVIVPVEGCQGGRIENANPTGDRTTLVWAEEFEEDGAPCVKNWNHETIPPNNGSWWNEEVQYYTDRRDNSIVEDGVLKIIAKKENYLSKEYTSARMTTQRLFEFRYGRVEIRAKLPEGQGTWPALWFLGANIDTVSWPTCGEIDLMEHGDGEPGLVSSTVHRANNNGDNYYRRGDQVIENESSEFHIYKMIWTNSSIQFFVDDVKHHDVTYDPNTPFNKYFFIILNVAMGGTFTGNNIDPNFTSSALEVDYIRVYQ
ncbi:MAG: glycoside hydrolase family 16 protein [Flavobacteriaceae bacterium]